MCQVLRWDLAADQLNEVDHDHDHQGTEADPEGPLAPPGEGDEILRLPAILGFAEILRSRSSDPPIVHRLILRSGGPMFRVRIGGSFTEKEILRRAVAPHRTARWPLTSHRST